MLSPLVKFGEWLPDKGALNNPGAFMAVNVVAVGDDYSCVETVGETTNALPGECLGFFGAVDNAGNASTFAGTATGLYRLSGTSWNNVSKSGGYNTTDINRWRFVQYGNFVVATNYNDAMQVFDLGSASVFSDLAGSPPRAKFLAVVNNFLFAVQTYDTTGGQQNFRTWWSGLDDITKWTPSQSTQADYQDTPGYGSCTALVGSATTGILFLTGGIYQVQYDGPPTIFSFLLVEPNKGTSVAGSVVSYSNLVFYYGEDGFNMFDGQRSTAIGYEKFDNWFKSRVDFDNIHKMQAIINPRRKQVIWSFPSIGGNGVCDTLLVYNWTNGRATPIYQPSESLAVTYNQAALTDSFGDLTDSSDSLTDAVQYVGGRPLLGVMTGDHKLAFFSGAARDGEIHTSEQRLNPSGRAYVSAVVPVVDCPLAKVELLTRDGQNDTPMGSGLVSLNPLTEEANFHNDSRYQRLRVTLSGPWTRAQGVQVEYEPTSRL